MPPAMVLSRLNQSRLSWVPLVSNPRCCAAGHRQGTGPSRSQKAPWDVVPKEVGAPTRGIDLALGAKALTPRDTDLASVLGPGLHYHGWAILAPNGPWVEVAEPALVPRARRLVWSRELA